MHLRFVDERGTPTKPNRTSPRYLVFGGVVIPEERWPYVWQKLVGLKTSNKYRGEVKWRYFSPRNNDANNPMRGWSQERRDDFRDSFFRILTREGALRIIAGVSDAPLAYKLPNVNHQEDIYFRTYKVVTERFQYFLQDVSKESGAPYFWNHGRGPQERSSRPQNEGAARTACTRIRTVHIHL